ncbi:hypothetical protein [Promicromonospora aerolata]|uniref:Uncharacterized protein n=1 Tax=Promicromonospora aerolata TaxID=195749 RepID=A0ABW4V3A1_9MICO
MADGTDKPVTDGSSTDSPGAVHPPNTDPGRVARIVAALRAAHAAQAASAAAGTAAAVPADVAAADVATVDTAADTAADTSPVDAAGSVELPDAPAPRRETSGVRSTRPPVPGLRWDPGSRYRASRLANRPVPQPPPAGPAAPAAAGPLPAAPSSAAAPVPPPPTPPPPPAPPALAGRLFRGPARRTGVFEREIWYPVTPSSRVPRDVSEALVAAVERYRKGSISTSGLVRAIGRAHAA